VRRTDLPDARIVRLKRDIDDHNRRRNEAVAALDRALLEALVPGGAPNAEVPLHSESPGQILDRLSILCLRAHHLREERDRGGAPGGHADRCRALLASVEEQLTDLAGCYGRLVDDLLAGQRRFKTYGMVRTYYDRELNPSLRRGGEGS
jgi:hypothetical protein